MSPTPDASLVRIGWDDEVEQFAAPHLAAGRSVGRVSATSRGFDTVRTPDGDVLSDRSLARHRAAGLDGPPVVGDWAAVEQVDRAAAVVALAPRRGVVVRRDPGEHADAQVVAANVDVVGCVFGLDRPVSLRRVERLLVLVHEGGASPCVILTKADAASVEELRAVLDDLATLPGTPPVVVTSVRTGTGLDDINRLLLPARTLALLGESGAGKSTLTNALVGSDLQHVGDVRARDRRGRHTTTVRRLLPCPEGGAVIDTPGLRALGMWDAVEGLAEAFPDIVALAPRCRFRNCTHRDEPGCAVRRAVASGELAKARHRSYLDLRAELDDVEDRRVARVRRHGEGRRPRPAPRVTDGLDEIDDLDDDVD
ncbi:MAG: ribosome small subunit-dependent GTPase A [Actinobacteria bacterium]|nr:ribosome small subunit-dependent GTPase A [Actinomycetota bacterium]